MMRFLPRIVMISLLLAGCTSTTTETTCETSTETIDTTAATTEDQPANPDQVPFEEDQGTSYERLATMLKEGDYKNAEALLKDNAFRIKDYEEARVGTFQCFHTLLFRFSAGTWGNEASQKAIEFLLKHSADP